MEDEEVCTEDIETPWGYVAGCKDLDDTVISDGPYGGKKLDEVPDEPPPEPTLEPQAPDIAPPTA
jgi:hypothetical protein